MMAGLLNLFYQRLPVRLAGADEELHLLNKGEQRRIRSSERLAMVVGAALSVLGFLAYYLPIYWYPQLFPAVDVKIPWIEKTVSLPWGELFWAILLTAIELELLVFLNVAGVHEIAVATGFISPKTKAAKCGDLLQIGLEKKPVEELVRYGIDPFEGLNKWALFAFNALFRLKGLLGSLVIRYLTRLLLGRYAVRSLLDFSGMPLYMAINAYAVRAVLREARVIIIGQTLIVLLIQRLPRWPLAAAEKSLLYDTLQYIAVSKRDFHQNHYLLTGYLLEHFQIPSEERHPLPGDYLRKLGGAPVAIGALCRLLIVLGFILDGRISGRESRKLRQLNSDGILRESREEVKSLQNDFVRGAGVEPLFERYLSRIETDKTTAELVQYAIKRRVI